MKTTLMMLAMFYSLSSLAQIGAPSTNVREGGGLPQLPTTVPADFNCKFEYDQQVAQTYMKLVGTKNIRTHGGPEKDIEIKLEELTWTAEIDDDDLFKQEGNKTILPGGYVSFNAFYNSRVPLKAHVYMKTPSVSPVNSPDDKIYSGESVYVLFKDSKAQVSDKVGFVFSQKNSESYVINLAVDCSVTLVP